MKLREKSLKNKLNTIYIEALKNEIVQIREALAQYKITFDVDRQDYNNGLETLFLQTMTKLQEKDIQEAEKV